VSPVRAWEELDWDGDLPQGQSAVRVRVSVEYVGAMGGGCLTWKTKKDPQLVLEKIRALILEHGTSSET